MCFIIISNRFKQTLLQREWPPLSLTVSSAWFLLLSYCSWATTSMSTGHRLTTTLFRSRDQVFKRANRIKIFIVSQRKLQQTLLPIPAFSPDELWLNDPLLHFIHGKAAQALICLTSSLRFCSIFLWILQVSSATLNDQV